jgi:hypothetical protein
VPRSGALLTKLVEASCAWVTGREAAIVLFGFSATLLGRVSMATYREIRQRGLGGKFCQLLFWCVNLLFVYLTYKALAITGEVASTAASDAGRAGAGLQPR